MSFHGSIVGFLIALLLGALGIYVGARFVADVDDYTYAVVTAVIASLVWVVVAFFFGWIPFLGPLLALVAYVTVINFRYPGGWVNAAGIALIAWVASIVLLYALAVAGVTAFEALGVPGA